MAISDDELLETIEQLRVQNENLRQRLKNNKEATDAEIERLQIENERLQKRVFHDGILG